MMLSLIERVVILARDMLLAIAIDNIAYLSVLRVRLPSCIVMRLGSCSLLNLLAYVCLICYMQRYILLWFIRTTGECRDII